MPTNTNKHFLQILYLLLSLLTKLTTHLISNCQITNASTINRTTSSNNDLPIIYLDNDPLPYNNADGNYYSSNDPDRFDPPTEDKRLKLNRETCKIELVSLTCVDETGADWWFDDDAVLVFVLDYYHEGISMSDQIVACARTIGAGETYEFYAPDCETSNIINPNLPYPLYPIQEFGNETNFSNKNMNNWRYFKEGREWWDFAGPYGYCTGWKVPYSMSIYLFEEDTLCFPLEFNTAGIDFPGGCDDHIISIKDINLQNYFPKYFPEEYWESYGDVSLGWWGSLRLKFTRCKDIVSLPHEQFFEPKIYPPVAIIYPSILEFSGIYCHTGSQNGSGIFLRRVNHVFSLAENNYTVFYRIYVKYVDKIGGLPFEEEKKWVIDKTIYTYGPFIR